LLLPPNDCHALHNAWCLQEGRPVWKQLKSLCKKSHVLLEKRVEEVLAASQQQLATQELLAAQQQRQRLAALQQRVDAGAHPWELLRELLGCVARQQQ
jgi:hypothetical protein